MDFAGQLAVLKAQFVGELQGKLAELRAALDEDRGKAQRLAHKLAGSSGSYGLTEVSVAVRTLEDALANGASHEQLLMLFSRVPT